MIRLVLAQASQVAETAPTVAAAVATAIPEKGSVPSPVWERAVRDAFTSFRLGAIDSDGWLFLAQDYGLRALFVLVLMSLAWTASSWSSSAVRVALGRIRFDETLTIFFSKLVRWVILLLVALTCLSYFGIETTGFAALIGAAGLAIGLAFQGTLSNFAAGMMLLMFRPYKVGDQVNVAGYLGTVREIELFTTAIDTFDNRRVIVPNSGIFGAVIENVTHNPVRRVDIGVGASYSADVDHTRRVLERAVSSVPLVLREPKPAVALAELGPSSVNWQVRAWTKREDFGATKDALIRAVKLEMDGAGIAIPFPQMQLHFDLPTEDTARRVA